jgi:hypothetical protein
MLGALTHLSSETVRASFFIGALQGSDGVIQLEGWDTRYVTNTLEFGRFVTTRELHCNDEAGI